MDLICILVGCMILHIVLYICSFFLWCWVSNWRPRACQAKPRPHILYSCCVLVCPLLEKCWVKVTFKIMFVLFFCNWVIGIPLICWKLSSYQIHSFQVFPLLVGSLLTLYVVCFAVKIFNLMWSHLTNFVFDPCPFGVKSIKSLQRSVSRSFSLYVCF